MKDTESLVVNANPETFESAPSDQFTLSADHTFTLNRGSMSLWSPDVGDFSFHNNGQEMLRFSADGAIYVRGELMETNRDVVDGLKRMLGIDVKPTLPSLPSIAYSEICFGTPVITQIDNARSGATCACGHFNEYQTAPYTCYQCRNNG